MNIAMITPHLTPAVRGNAITVRRIAATLTCLGCDVQVFSCDLLTEREMRCGMERCSPGVIHAFHGYFGGRIARQAGRDLGVPYIVTLTGTDLHEMATDHRRAELTSILEEAAALVIFDRSMLQRVDLLFPQCIEKVAVIPQGVKLPENWLPPSYDEVQDEIVLFLPAGLREVKNVLFPLSPLADLYRKEPRLRFVLAGPILNPAYASEVLATLSRYPFARYAGEVAHDSVWRLYREATVVLNTSRFEGGMPNSILEALAAGCPVLASEIPGNSSLVQEGKTGFLYRTEEEFRQKAAALVADPTLCRRLGEEGARLVSRDFTEEKEGQAYLQLYRKVAATPIPF